MTAAAAAQETTAMTSENDAYLARPTSPTIQLALPVNVESKEPNLTPEQRLQRENIAAFLADCRADTAIYLAVVQSHYPEANYTNLADVTTEHLGACHDEYAAHPFRPGRFSPPNSNVWGDLRSNEAAVRGNSPQPKAKKAQVYKPWTLERRQRTAATKLLDRYRKRYSIGELWIDQAQADLLRDPFRFGLCPLAAEGACNIPDPERELRRRNAIAIETQFREQEQGLVQPLNLPVAVPAREYEYALAQPTMTPPVKHLPSPAAATHAAPSRVERSQSSAEVPTPLRVDSERAGLLGEVVS